jgi:hypothetical protein
MEGLGPTLRFVQLISVLLMQECETINHVWNKEVNVLLVVLLDKKYRQISPNAHKI